MEKIDSFKINHLVLQPGVYESRRDTTPAGNVITTYDIRLTAPNRQEAVRPEVLHTIEHLAATWLRNNAQWQSKTVYWGPMGCCTGCYFIVQGNYPTKQIASLMKQVFTFIAGFEGEIPGATARDCGNYLFNDLEGARLTARGYLKVLEHATDENLNYPQ